MKVIAEGFNSFETNKKPIGVVTLTAVPAAFRIPSIGVTRYGGSPL